MANGLPMGAGRAFRSLNLPALVQVHADEEGTPQRVKLGGQWRRLEAVQDNWRIVDEWWRLEVRRWYWRLAMEDGMLLTLYQGRNSSERFRQNYG